MATPMTNLTTFLHLVNPHAPGAASQQMLQALRQSAIEFCERTRCWRHRAEIDLTEQGQAIVAPDESEIHEIERAEFNDMRLTPVQFDDVPFEDIDTSAGTTPAMITQETFNQVSIVPFEAGTLKVSLILKPRHGDDMQIGADGFLQNAYDSVPAFLHSRYSETIAAGAIARLLVMPQQPFTNPDLAMLHGRRFDQGVDNANGARVRGQHRARPRSRAAFF